MRCPYCGKDDTRVIDSRPVEDNNSIRRRRICDSCGKRFTTYEKIEMIPMMVTKKDKPATRDRSARLRSRRSSTRSRQKSLKGMRRRFPANRSENWSWLRSISLILSRMSGLLLFTENSRMWRHLWRNLGKFLIPKSDPFQRARHFVGPSEKCLLKNKSL